MELMGCQGLAVPGQVMHHVVRVESSFNPYAIGVVGGRLQRQPKNLSEALSTVRMLESRGYNFSLGLAQVNRYNLQKYGLDSYERAFDKCANLVAGSQILAECYHRSGADWGKSFSCYYSGNFTTGFRHGYVQKIYASMRQGRDVDLTPSTPAIEVVSRQARRTVPVSRYPLYASAGAAPALNAGAPMRAATPGPASQPSPRPSRMQDVPSRVVADRPSAPAEGQVQGSTQVPVGYVQSAPVAAAAPVPSGPVRAQPVATEGPAPVVLAQPASVAASPSATPAQPASAVQGRPRQSRDPALIGGQSPEQDGAFVF